MSVFLDLTVFVLTTSAKKKKRGHVQSLGSIRDSGKLIILGIVTFAKLVFSPQPKNLSLVMLKVISWRLEMKSCFCFKSGKFGRILSVKLPLLLHVLSFVHLFWKDKKVVSDTVVCN